MAIPTMTETKTPADGASLPEPPPPKRKVRGADMVQKCWWLLLPVIIIAITLAFLPPEMLPNNMVSFFRILFSLINSIQFCPFSVDCATRVLQVAQT